MARENQSVEGERERRVRVGQEKRVYGNKLNDNYGSKKVTSHNVCMNDMIYK